MGIFKISTWCNGHLFWICFWPWRRISMPVIRWSCYWFYILHWSKAVGFQNFVGGSLRPGSAACCLGLHAQLIWYHLSVLRFNTFLPDFETSISFLFFDAR